MSLNDAYISNQFGQEVGGGELIPKSCRPRCAAIFRRWFWRHGDEVFDAAIATGAGTCLLKCSIHRFDPAVVFAGCEAVEYARKVLGKGPAEALEGFQSATTGPTQPALQRGLGLVPELRAFRVSLPANVADAGLKPRSRQVSPDPA